MRSSWQIDLKWMLGLVACALIVAGCALYSLSHLTARDTAIPLGSALVSAGIADRISDEEYAQIQAAAAANPSGSFTISPLSLSFNGSEIVGLDKNAAAAVIGAKLTGVMYDNGEAAAKSLIVTPPPESGKEPVQLGPIGVLTASNHNLFTQLFMITAAVALIALGGVAMMARGWGRLGAPAFISMIGVAPFTAVWALGKGAIGTSDPTESVFTQNARVAFEAAAGDLSSLFLMLAGATVAIAVMSLIGSVISLALVKSTSTAAEPDTPPPAPATPPTENKPRPQVKPEGILRASPSLAATTYRVSGTTQVVPKQSEASASNQRIA